MAQALQCAKTDAKLNAKLGAPVSASGLWLLPLLVLALACSGSEQHADGGSLPSAAGSGERAQCASFDSTFAAIQSAIFEKHGCTDNRCHGKAVSGGLDLRSGMSYQSLFEVKAQGSALKRVEPGLPGRSYLYLKLEAATNPERAMISNSPMPVGLPPLSPGELEAVMWWIRGGAPKTGVVTDNMPGGSSKYIAGLLDACLPPPKPVPIEPLAPPPADEGIQLVMPTVELPAQSELEVCFAYYYDFTDRVPARFKDEKRGVFFIKNSQVRQDPQSHHLSVLDSTLDASHVNDAAFGKWTCWAGPSAGGSCDPLDASSCGEGGLCASERKPSNACIGFGPPGSSLDITGGSRIASAATAQYYEEARAGVYREVPLKALAYFNAHAFNLAPAKTTLHAWANFFYTDDLQYLKQFRTVSKSVGIAKGTPPFTKKDYCSTWVAPQGTTLTQLGSHTHKRGEYFWINDPAKKKIYESYDYADPVTLDFDPALVLDSPKASERTFEYCATFNNGVANDGSPDVRMVTRLSTMPARTTCTPVACVAGKVGAACNGADDNAACDSTPGKGDGVCDACAITSGFTSEDEMFLINTTTIAPAPAAK